MPIDRSRLGAEYQAPTFEVTDDRIAAYADATLDPLPGYREPGAVAPPVFAIVPAWPAIAAALADESLGLRVDRIVHGEQRFAYHRPIRAGDVLSTTGRIASIEDKGANEVLVLALRTLDAAGEPVVDQEVVTVSRGTAAGAPPPGAPGAPRPPRPAPAGQPPPDDERPVVVPEDVTYAYAKASGDNNRIHIDPDFARDAGLGGIIVHGLCTLAIAAQGVVEEVAGGDAGRLRTLTARFARPLRPGTTLTTRLWRAPDGARFESAGPDGVVLRDGTARVDGS